jgi:hypothetical protein
MTESWGSTIEVCEERFDILLIRVYRELSYDDILLIINVLEGELLKCTKDRLALHIKHESDVDSNILSVWGVMPIVSWLMKHTRLIETKLQGTVIQPRNTDSFMKDVLNTFLCVYTPQRSFYVMTRAPTPSDFKPSRGEVR